MRLVLIRHARTLSNVGGLLDARVPEPGLTELGAQQAAALSGALGMRGDDRAKTKFLPLVEHWAAGDLSRRIDGGEPGHESFDRFDGVVEEAVRDASAAAGAGIPTEAIVGRPRPHRRPRHPRLPRHDRAALRDLSRASGG